MSAQIRGHGLGLLLYHLLALEPLAQALALEPLQEQLELLREHLQPLQEHVARALALEPLRRPTSEQTS